MKAIALFIAALSLSACAQTIDAAEAARRDSDPVLNGHVSDVKKDAK